MRSPLRVEFFSDLDRNEDSSASSLGFGAKPSRWGHPYRVVLRMSAHSIGTKAYSIHLSFVASRWGHPLGRVWCSSHSIESKSSLDSWLVFLQDGVTLSGQILAIWSRLKELPQLGSWERVSSPSSGWVFVILGSAGLPWSRGEFHIQLSSLLVMTLYVSLLPTKEWVLALLLLLALLPLALPWRVGVLRRPRGDSFHQGISCDGIPCMVAR